MGYEQNPYLVPVERYISLTCIVDYAVCAGWVEFFDGLRFTPLILPLPCRKHDWKFDSGACECHMRKDGT